MLDDPLRVRPLLQQDSPRATIARAADYSATMKLPVRLAAASSAMRMLLLHRRIEAVGSRIEFPVIRLWRARRLVSGDASIGGVRAGCGEQRVVQCVLNEQRRRGMAGGDIRPIATDAPAGGKEHPGVRSGATVQQLVVGAHHANNHNANNHTSAQMVRGRAQNCGSQAAAGRSDACDLESEIDGSSSSVGTQPRERERAPAGPQSRSRQGPRIVEVMPDGVIRIVPLDACPAALRSAHGEPEDPFAHGFESVP